jgi:DNA-binding beta-propeller fold protein YncE
MPSRNSWGAMTRSTIIVVASAAIAIGALACSSGGGADARRGCPDAGAGAPAMAVEVWYPPGSGLMTSDSLTVRGGSCNPSTIVAVRVNGVLATTTSGFAEWEAEIPLALGTTTVIVEGEDVDGQVATVATVTITRPEAFDLWRTVGAAALDPSAPRALVVEETVHHLNVWPSGKTLSFIDLETGARDRLPDDWPRDALYGAFAVAPDFANNRLLVTAMRQSNGSGNGVYEIDLGTGARTLISDDQRGSGPLLGWPFALAIDHAHDRAVVLSIGDLYYGRGGSIVAVDLNTGDRTKLPSGGVDAGVIPREPVDLVLDPAGDIAYVLDSELEALLSVDLATGARTVLASGLKVRRQRVFDDPAILMMRSDMELDVTNRRALILGPSGELQAIDLATGDHTLMVSCSTASAIESSSM